MADPLLDTLEALERERDQGRQDLAEARYRAAELEAACLSLRAVVDRGLMSSSAQRQTEDWSSMTRIDAVARVLAGSPRPLSPQEVSERLQEVGRNDDATAVSAALNQLRMQGRGQGSDGRGPVGICECQQ